MAGILCLLANLPMIVRAAPSAAFVMDARTGEVLYEDNADTRLHPASLTKMMTLYLTFQAIERGQISLDTKAVISKNAAGKPPSRLGLRPGQKIAVRYLIRAAALRSANDAATALGELLGASEPGFAKRMNAAARQIGMTRTTFVNPHGWTAAGHLSTARDMTILGRRLFLDFPQYYNIFSRRTSDAGIAEVANTNRRFLDSYRGADGIKTGFTNAAGFNLTASAERDGKRVLATVLGGSSSPDRNAKMAGLLDLGFRKAPSRGKALPEPGLMAEADPETPRIAAAVASAQAAVKSAQSMMAKTAEDGDGAPRTSKPQAPRTVIATSARPKGRPAMPPDPAVTAAIRDNIADLVEEVQGADEARPSAGLVIATAAPATRPAADGAARGPAAAASLLAIPVEPPTDPAPAPQTAMIAAAAPKSRPARSAAPAAAAPAALAAAAAAPVSLAAAADAPAEATGSVEAVAGPADPPPAWQAEARVAAIAPGPEEPEVVTRLSTSGGRYWGISLGRFNSRYEAEKRLLRTALSEMGTLDDGLRRVVQRPTGFDATFMGLTRETADLACRRLQARNVECFTIGP